MLCVTGNRSAVLSRLDRRFEGLEVHRDFTVVDLKLYHFSREICLKMDFDLRYFDWGSSYGMELRHGRKGCCGQVVEGQSGTKRNASGFDAGYYGKLMENVRVEVAFVFSRK